MIEVEEKVEAKTNTSSLPNNWKVVRLGDYAKTEKGKKPKCISKEKTEECSIPYVNIKAFEKNQIDEYTDGKGCVICEDGDFLMVWDGSRSGYIGKAIKGALGSTLMRIKLPDVNEDYAYYFLQSKFIELNTRAKGVGIPHVDPNILWNYQLPLPPLSEQQAIVAKIEELFSALDKGKQQLEEVRQQLKVYRQAVLKWAFEGKLTNGTVCEGKLPEGWRTVSLGEFIQKIDAGKSLKCDERPPREGEIGIVKVSAVTWGDFDEMESKTILSEDHFNENYLINRGDFLFSRANTIDLVGTCVIVKDFQKRLMLSDKILRFTFKEDMMKEYALYFLRSKAGRIEIESNSTGNQDSMRNIGQQRIRQIQIPYCPIEEQQHIVQEIESKFSVCEKMEETIEQSLLQAETLRQSILKRAFEGRLVEVITSVTEVD